MVLKSDGCTPDIIHGSVAQARVAPLVPLPVGRDKIGGGGGGFASVMSKGTTIAACLRVRRLHPFSASRLAGQCSENAGGLIWLSNRGV